MVTYIFLERQLASTGLTVLSVDWCRTKQRGELLQQLRRTVQIKNIRIRLLTFSTRLCLVQQLPINPPAKLVPLRQRSIKILNKLLTNLVVLNIQILDEFNKRFLIKRKTCSP